MDLSRLCLGCMKEKPIATEVCPRCGFSLIQYRQTASRQALPAETILHGRYLLGRVLGQGGYGITYLAMDLKHEERVAVKEYFPTYFAGRRGTSNLSAGTSYLDVQVTGNLENFRKGLEDMEQEAELLRQNYAAGIVHIRMAFRENETFYIVMEYNRGMTLVQYRKLYPQRITEEHICFLLRPVIKAMIKLHRRNIIHRDISPQNIMVDRDGNAVLVDFGAAKTIDPNAPRDMVVVLKHRYAPPEQYSGTGNVGPWTDVYGMCATIYSLLTGSPPRESIERRLLTQADDFAQLVEPLRRAGLSQHLIHVLITGLMLDIRGRFASAKELYNALYH